MSRHELASKVEDHDVTVGWDAPMNTYFAQVEDLNVPDGTEPLVLWLGGNFDEVQDARNMIEPLRPWADLDDAMIATLEQDRATRNMGQ